MCNLWKFIFVLQFFLSYCDVYYDDEGTLDVMKDENEKSEIEDFKMLIHGGYHWQDPLFDKYIVSIRTRKPTEFFGDNHYCAGTVIGQKMVLTAGHCLMDSRRIKTRVRRLLVVAGTPNRLHHTSQTREFQVVKTFVHPLFKRNSIHDIAIIMLDEEVPFGNKAIRTMSLANKRPAINTTCLIAGWGQLFKNGPYAAKIVYAILNITSDEMCEDVYGSKYNRQYNLCANDFRDMDRDVCFGDSGGPLVCDSRLAGIISWGVDCGVNKYPTVFTDVFSHFEWLMDVKNDADRIKLSLKELLFGNLSFVVVAVFVINIFKVLLPTKLINC